MLEEHQRSIKDIVVIVIVSYGAVQAVLISNSNMHTLLLRQIVDFLLAATNGAVVARMRFGSTGFM